MPPRTNRAIWSQASSVTSYPVLEVEQAVERATISPLSLLQVEIRASITSTTSPVWTSLISQTNLVWISPISPTSLVWTSLTSPTNRAASSGNPTSRASNLGSKTCFASRALSLDSLIHRDKFQCRETLSSSVNSTVQVSGTTTGTLAFNQCTWGWLKIRKKLRAIWSQPTTQITFESIMSTIQVHTFRSQVTRRIYLWKIWKIV